MVSMNGINQYKIVLRPDEVQEFVNEASRYDFDIDIAYNSYVVDAKSILRCLWPGPYPCVNRIPAMVR